MARPPRITRTDVPTVPLPAGILKPEAMRPAPLPIPELDALDVEINTMAAGVGEMVIDPETGAASTELENGDVLINFEPEIAGREPGGAKAHDANLAEHIDQSELSRIAQELLTGIQFDDASRKQWIEMRAQGIKLLGLTIETPRNGTDASVALEGMSTVRNPLLLEAVLRFQANARGELLPASGPVKVSDQIDENSTSDSLAKSLEDGLNYYLTVVATEYYPDTDRALFYTGFGGCSFKKVYNCPIRRRPVSESVDAEDLIVSNAATDMRNSARVTQQIRMRPSTLKRMQLAGAYRNVPIGSPAGEQANAIEQQKAQIQGVDAQTQQTEDREHMIYEVYCELNIRGFEHKEKGEATGLQLPYRVVIEKDSQQVLEVRRNWAEDDDRKLAKICFVKYPYVPGIGFYDIGLIHILGNTTNALTAAWRELLDAGMFANFPGFIYAKSTGRQNTNEFRVPPGGGVGLQTDGMSIGDAIMPLPYKDIGPAFTQFIDHIMQTGQRVGGTAEINVGEGKQDAPVGTTLALIEQATKIQSAVHKRLHAAQAEEFQLLKECFRENPQAFLDSVKTKGNLVWNEATFLAALEDASIVPQADPNVPSHMHRLMKAMAYKQLQAANPTLYDAKAVDTRVLRMLGDDDPEALFAKGPAQEKPDPKVIEAMMKEKAQQQKIGADERDAQVKLHIQDQESADQAAERQSREKLAQMSLIKDIITHPEPDAVLAQAQRFAGGIGPQ